MASVLSLTNISFHGPENTHILKRERGRDSGIVSISLSSQSQDYRALLSLRVCCCPCIGFNFNPLSTSAMRLLPTAIYCGQIERFQGASRFALAPSALGRLLTPLLRLLTHRQSSLPSGFVRAGVIATKSLGKKMGWGRRGGREASWFSKAKRQDGSGPIS